jgi:predicted lipoprotein with Yx(FWY)xxD motif
VAEIDRFSDKAGHLQVRSTNPALPAANAPIDFDQPPFITLGLGPQGDLVTYYNFDVQPTAPPPIYVFFKAGSATPVDGQFNVVDVIPGDTGYGDFWNVVKVTVPDDYQPNEIRSAAELKARHYPMMSTTTVVNCPIVPAGSTAKLRYGGNVDTGLHQGWYHNSIVTYFNFPEKALALTSSGEVPVSPIYVTFNKNPVAGDASSGPASGFEMDRASGRTHNVIESVPEDAEYSPLWSVNVYDDRNFASVHDLASAAAASILASRVATVNCPVVARTAPSVDAPARTVQTSAGTILATAEGLSLYTYDPDTSGSSTCYGSCAVAWPPLLATAAVAAPFATTTRTDGSKQVVYENHPLYRYVGDGKTGDVFGDGLGGVWHVARP